MIKCYNCESNISDFQYQKNNNTALIKQISLFDNALLMKYT